MKQPSAMNIAILGATKGMGRALARELAGRGHRLCLLGRDAEDLEKCARDLEVRTALRANSVPIVVCDLLQPEMFASAFDAIGKHFRKLDAIIVTAGAFGTQEALENDTALLSRVLSTNFTHTILFCEQARKHLLASGGGTLCAFSSVAGDRARKPVILYGASKAGLSHYLEGLDHKYRADGLVTINVKPGFVKTSMTDGLKPPPFAGEAEQVARDVAKAIEHGTPVLYTPFMWRWVILVIRNLPRFIMRRIGF